MEKIKCPEDHIAAVLERAKPEYVSKTYKVDFWENAEDFLEKLAFQMGKLLKVKDKSLPFLPGDCRWRVIWPGCHGGSHLLGLASC